MSHHRVMPFYISITYFFLALWGIAVASLPTVVNGKALPSLADMLERVTGSVVNIATQGRGARSDGASREYQYYFGNKQQRKKGGTGSGIIVDAKKGYVVTNAHVIEGSGKIMVRLNDGREFEARVIGKDPKADVAVIQIPAKRLTAIRFANSDKLRVGDFVVAIGNPYGLGQTATSGIVSAMGRTGLGIEDYEDFIQTDAPINPGNSGGALVNLRGELIGVNTAILGGKSGGSVGIGFAIPSNMIKNIKGQLISYGQVVRGQLGVEIQDLRPILVKAFGLKNSQGALISAVVVGSPADKAGIEAGDVVTHVNGMKIKSSANLKNRIGNLQVGSKVNLGYIRNGKHLRRMVVVGKISPNQYQKQNYRHQKPLGAR
ncbi:MAG: trypsin-like peptidase domain-containing protein [Cocleimonas sp.]|nr:trypsin-like peptidase domain-containing protein [Cocleimonas sp.]